MAQNGSEWLQNGSEWLKLVQNSFEWLRMARNGYFSVFTIFVICETANFAIFFRFDGLFSAHNGSEWLRMAYNGSEYFRMAQNCLE